jgi:hypothetical protein
MSNQGSISGIIRSYPQGKKTRPLDLMESSGMDEKKRVKVHQAEEQLRIHVLNFRRKHEDH